MKEKENARPKVILITGASSGMGKVSTEALIKEGNIVYCAARSVDKMKDLEKLGGHVLEMDVAKYDKVIMSQVK